MNGGYERIFNGAEGVDGIMANDAIKEASGTFEALEKLLDGRVENYEIFFSGESGIGVEVRGGSVDALKVRKSAGVGLRIISKGRPGFGFSSVLSSDALKDMVDKTIKASSVASEDNYLAFPGAAPASVSESLQVFDDSFGEAAEEEKIGRAMKIEESAKAFDNRVKSVRKASYQESVISTRIVNSSGMDIRHSATFFSGSVTAVAGDDNESQMGWDMDTSHKRSSIDPDRIGKGAARNAVRMLGAKKIGSMKCPAIIENTVACELLEALASSFLGDNVEKGKSMLIGKAGKKIASAALNIWDNGVLPGGWAASLFDGEGYPRKKTPLVIEGVFDGYLYDTYWAARAGAKSTGNASRGSFKGVPGIGISNLYIEKGGKTFTDLLKEVGEGLFITEVMGAHTINTISGDFSLGAAGFRVEGGEAAYPVRGMAISGNLLRLFERVGSCGEDIRFIGSIGAPSLFVHEIEASGS